MLDASGRADDSVTDMYYLQLPTGGPTQADVWTNLPTQHGVGDTCTGMIITPRCDFAHSKSPVVNYLPLVPLRQYLLTSACFPLVEQAITDTRDFLKSKSNRLGIAHLFDLNLPLEEIVSNLRSSNTSSSERSEKHYSACLREFNDGWQRYVTLTGIASKDELKIEEIKQFVKNKQFVRLQRDIILNNSSDSFFIPSCRGLIEEPSVVLLRHIYTCDIELLDERSRSMLGGKSPERLLRLNSPFMESLMAKLASLFTRVGTRDLPPAVVEGLISSFDELP
jgi:hypothetical protein